MSQPLDGLRRRRIYLMRHADAAYWDEDGQRAGDSRLVPLSKKGMAEADAMRAFLADAQFDRIVCSGLPRTRMTAEIVGQNRDLDIEVEPDLEEIKAGGAPTPDQLASADPKEVVNWLAYSFWNMTGDGEETFRGGETLKTFMERVLRGYRTVMARDDWSEMLMVCHGGVNRALLTHLLGGPITMFPAFEQDSACVNVIDLDSRPDDPSHTRVIIRGVNITPTDTAKHARRHTTLETFAVRLNSMFGNPLGLAH